MSWLDDLKDRWDRRPKSDFSTDNAKKNLSKMYDGSNLQSIMNSPAGKGVQGFGQYNANLFKNLNNSIAGAGYVKTGPGKIGMLPNPPFNKKTSPYGAEGSSTFNKKTSPYGAEGSSTIGGTDAVTRLKQLMQSQAGNMASAAQAAALRKLMGNVTGGGSSQQEGIPSIPQFGGTLADYLGSAGGSPVNVEFGKKLADYLAMSEYQPEVWAKDQLAAHDQFNTKMEHRGDIGSQGLSTIYSQLGDELGGLKKESVQGYQNAIDQTTSRNESAQGARQEAYANQRMADDARRSLLLGEDAMTGVSNAQANVDSSFGQDTQSNTARGNSVVDNLTSRQQTAGDKFGQIQGAAGFRGGEAQQALMADVNAAIASNETGRINTLGNARNEARGAATQHYGTDYSQFSDEVGRKLQQQAQAQDMALQKYNADYSQFANDRNFENLLSQQQYGQYRDQQGFAADQQKAAMANIPEQQGPGQTKLDEILNSQSVQGVPPALQQIIIAQLGANRANPDGAIADPSKEIRRLAQLQGIDMDDPAMAPAWSMIYQMMNLK